jgi:predicted nucleic acid-binding protein
VIVLVDTPVWSLALRRRALPAGQHRFRDEWQELIREGRARLIGPIRQELLTGIREEAAFRSLREKLRAFEEPDLTVEDFEEAAALNNRLRAHGIAASGVDCLICSAAIRRRWEVFTLDQDFVRYARHLPLRLYRPRK